ncbi:MAG: methionine ABC transporter ATP-binding protein [Wohlfahrtiimonas sp.]
MIKLENISKSYPSSKGPVTALNNISLTIEAGEIFGIIGHSGAGKSTLIRCLNLLEAPTSGEVILDNVNLTKLTKTELMHERRKIGMIFQHFNLFDSQTIFNNIAFPLRLEKLSKTDVKKRVDELLELVGLTEHANKYPAQLSGGQKQRVGIARALANRPKVLLCDEATSALDPQTTQSILELLRDINQKLGLTIVLITHEMEVIRKICHKVGVIHASQIVESGPVEKVFLNPQHNVTKEFILDNSHYDELKAHLKTGSMKDANLYQITYSGEDSYHPHLSDIIKSTGVHFSILSGNISYIRDLPYGQLLVALNGTEEAQSNALKEFSAKNIHTLAVTL